MDNRAADGGNWKVVHPRVFPSKWKDCHIFLHVLHFLFFLPLKSHQSSPFHFHSSSSLQLLMPRTKKRKLIYNSIFPGKCSFMKIYLPLKMFCPTKWSLSHTSSSFQRINKPPNIRFMILNKHKNSRSHTIVKSSG